LDHSIVLVHQELTMIISGRISFVRASILWISTIYFVIGKTVFTAI